MIPIALYGKTPADTAGLRKCLSDTKRPVNNGGYSSVYFDEVAKERVLDSINKARIHSKSNIKKNYINLRRRLGRQPMLLDFYNNQFVDQDPRAIIEKFENLPALIEYCDDITTNLPLECLDTLTFLTTQLANGKRYFECDILQHLIDGENEYSLPADSNAADVLDYEFFIPQHKRHFDKAVPVVKTSGLSVQLTQEFIGMLRDQKFYACVKDVIDLCKAINRDEYGGSNGLVIGESYSYLDIWRLSNFKKTEVWLNVGGYKTIDDCTPIFVKYKKDDRTSSLVKYADGFISRQEFVTISKSGRTLTSKDVQNYMNSSSRLLFVRKTDDEREKNWNYLGEVNILETSEDTVVDDKGSKKDIVKFRMELENTANEDLYNYITDDGKNIVRW
jgi:hypothetical protein